MRLFRSRRTRAGATALALATALSAGAVGLAPRTPAGAVTSHLQPAGGYILVASDGGIFTFGDAQFEGSLPGLGVRVNNIRAMLPSSDYHGYGLLGSDGGAFAFGDYPFTGSAVQNGIGATDLVGVAITQQGGHGVGGLLAGADGGVFTIAGAQFEGSLPGVGIHVTNIVGIVATADNQGYWLAGVGRRHLRLRRCPVLRPAAVGLESGGRNRRHLDGRGDLVVEQNGAVVAFGDAPSYGGLPDFHVAVNNIVALVPTPTGKGYWLIGSDGGVFTFGDAPFHGSLGSLRLAQPIVGAVSTP